MAATCTFVSNSVFTVIIQNFGRVFVTVTAESGNRPVNIFRLHFVFVVTVSVKAFFNYIAMLHCSFHAFCITVCTVTARLIQKFRMNSNARKLGLNVLFVMARIVFVTLKSIRNHSDWIAQIFFQNFRFRHISRNFSKHIVVVPRINKTHILATVAESTDNQINSNNFAEVSNMNSSARSNSRSAGIKVKFAFLLDNSFCLLVSPMAEF